MMTKMDIGLVLNKTTSTINKVVAQTKQNVVTKAQQIANYTKQEINKVVDFVKKIDVYEAVGSALTTGMGIVAITTGVATMALPIPGARLMGAGLIASGVATTAYGFGMLCDATSL